MTGRRHWAVAAALGGGLAAASWLALRVPAVQHIDVLVGDAVRRSGTPRLDQVVTHTTDLGSMFAVSGIAAVLAASDRRRLAADVIGVGTLAWIGAQASKTRVRRQRPYEVDGVRRLIAPPTGSSFPSGHATVAAAVMALLAEHARPPAAPLLRALAAYVPLTRVYVGVHYPTDVIGGAGLGLLLAGLWRGWGAGSRSRSAPAGAGLGGPDRGDAARVDTGGPPWPGDAPPGDTEQRLTDDGTADLARAVTTLGEGDR